FVSGQARVELQVAFAGTRFSIFSLNFVASRVCATPSNDRTRSNDFGSKPTLQPASQPWQGVRMPLRFRVCGRGPRRHLSMLIVIPGYCLALFLGASANADQRQIDVDGIERSYDLHVPSGIASGAPLVVVLHGRGSSGENEMVRGRWQALADK